MMSEYVITLHRTYFITAKDDEEAVDKAFDEFRSDIPHLIVNCNEFAYDCAEVVDA